MMRPGLAFAVTVFGLTGLIGAAIVSSPITAQTALDARFSDAPDAQRALDRAQRRSAQAQNRAARFEARAASASEASAKAQAEAAALAARVQQAEAAIGVAEAELALVQSEKRRIDLRLAERRAAAPGELLRWCHKLSTRRATPGGTGGERGACEKNYATTRHSRRVSAHRPPRGPARGRARHA